LLTLACAAATLVAACDVPPPRQGGGVAFDRYRDKPPPKPGESITHTRMCSCKVCRPDSCCRELEEEAPQLERCADDYDFSDCGMAVSSCDSRCFQHRWRTRIEVGCTKSRPRGCCYATEDS
jgi:hypothetical protein